MAMRTFAKSPVESRLNKVAEIDVLSFARIATVFLLWADQAEHLLPFHGLTFYHWGVGALFFTLSTTLLLGVFARSSAFLLGVLLWFLRSYEGVADAEFYHHHITLAALSCFILSCTDCARYFSIHRFLGIEKKTAFKPAYLPNAQVLSRALLSSVYLYATISKLRAESIDGSRFYEIFCHFYFGSVSIPSWVAPLAQITTWVVIFSEASLAVVPWFKKATQIAFLPAVCFI